MKARALLIVTLLISLSALTLRGVEPAQAQETSFHIVSDGTAKYSYTEEPGWETLGFDDSAWPFVVAPSTGLCDPSPVPPGAPNPVWGEDPQEFQTIFVRKTFTLDAAATANIIAAADDDYDLFINGVFIGGNHDGFAGGSDLYTNVPLQAGLNVLAMMAVDVVGGCQGLLFDVFPPPEPPANDDVANAVVISALDFTDTRDTRGATTAPDDPGSCFGGTNVWYVFTPSEDTIVRLITAGYEAFLDVFVSSAGELSHTGLCAFGQLDFVASAGTTYYFMVSSVFFGGDLVFSVLSLGPPVDITLVVASPGSFNHTGAATIGGTVTCSAETSYMAVYGTLRQRLGRKFITGGFYVTPGPCSPPSISWSATVIGDGVFSGGKVTVDVFADACGEFSCDSDSVSTTIRLTGGK